MKSEPFRIEPIFSPRIWGSRSLAPLFPDKTNLSEPIGEAWLTGFDCRVATGPFAGKTLGEAWREMPAEWRGEKFKEPGDFPLLLKFIFPKDKLSIQVHPDDAYASIHEKAAGGRGKTEMWHVVSAEPGARVLIGLKPGVDRERFLEALQAHTLEDLFQAHSVHKGDTFFLPAGTPHTIGPGMVLCEVQQYSDLTYRVYDYGRVDAQGRPRELHLQKALEIMEFGKTCGGKTAPLALYSGGGGHRKALPGGKRSLISACRYFAVERWEIYTGIDALGGTGVTFDIVVPLNGDAHLVWNRRVWKSGGKARDSGHAEISRGQCWFIPAVLGATVTTTSHAAIIRTYVPNLPNTRSDSRVEDPFEAVIEKATYP